MTGAQRSGGGRNPEEHASRSPGAEAEVGARAWYPFRIPAETDSSTQCRQLPAGRPVPQTEAAPPWWGESVSDCADELAPAPGSCLQWWQHLRAVGERGSTAVPAQLLAGRQVSHIK